MGSGKSTLARKLSDDLDLPWFELDNVSHRYKGRQRRRRTEEERGRLFAQLLKRPRWVMEDIGRAAFLEACERADLILLLDLRRSLCDLRILTRWIKQKLGLVYSNYRPTIPMLVALLKWSGQYHRTRKQRYHGLNPYRQKMIILHTRKEVREFTEQIIDRFRLDGDKNT